MSEHEFLSYKYLECEVRERIAYLTLNRPEKRNALNDIVMVELKHAVTVAESRQDVKVVVIRANGKAFCAGADLEYLKQMQQFTPEQNLADSATLADLFLTIYRSGKIFIAQVEGHAIAGGCGLATVCDFTFVVPQAKLGYTEVRIGFIPAVVMVFLLRKIGETRAKELLLSGKLIDAVTAERYNLINAVVEADQIQEYVYQFALGLCEKNSASSMLLTKKMIADIQTFPIEEALTFAAKMNARSRTTPDCIRGIGAFLNKEQISW